MGTYTSRICFNVRLADESVGTGVDRKAHYFRKYAVMVRDCNVNVRYCDIKNFCMGGPCDGLFEVKRVGELMTYAVVVIMHVNIEFTRNDHLVRFISDSRKKGYHVSVE